VCSWSSRQARQSAELLPDRVDRHRDGLALHGERPGGRGAEQGAGLLDDGRVGEQHAVRGLRHDPRRGVGGVAHRGVRRACEGTDLGREDVAPVDADLHRERRADVEDVAHRAQHPALVVLPRAGHARTHEQLAVR
jgi:hypothetical protein